LIIPKIDVKYDIAICNTSSISGAFTPNGINTGKYNDLIKLLKMTGIESIIFANILNDELHVITMYYPTGNTFFTKEFATKYLTGMKLKFIE
jgi:hypothetical protein